MKMIVLAALLAAAGCSKKSGSDCEAAITKGTDSLLATVKSGSQSQQMQDSRKELAGKLRTALTQRCNEDKWAPDAVECFTKLTSQAEMQACETKLSPEQRTKMRKDLIQVMGSMRMPGAGPGHPSTLAGSAAPGAGNAAAPGSPPPTGSTEPPAGAAPPAGATPPAGSTPPAAAATLPAAPPAPAAGSSSGW